MNKKTTIIFDLMAGIFDIIMCIVNIIQIKEKFKFIGGIYIMKINKKMLGLILGGLMSISLVGCSDTYRVEELILENVENTLQANLEEYGNRYDYLDLYGQDSIDTAKVIDIKKSHVEVEELKRKYEITLTLKLEDESEGLDGEYITIMEIDKDKFDFEMLKDEDLLYNNDIKVVAMITKNNNKVVLKNCTEDYRNRTDDCCIYDENTLKDMLCFALGDINIDSINFY